MRFAQLCMFKYGFLRLFCHFVLPVFLLVFLHSIFFLSIVGKVSLFDLQFVFTSYVYFKNIFNCCMFGALADF